MQTAHCGDKCCSMQEPEIDAKGHGRSANKGEPNPSGSSPAQRPLTEWDTCKCTMAILGGQLQLCMSEAQGFQLREDLEQ